VLGAPPALLLARWCRYSAWRGRRQPWCLPGAPLQHLVDLQAAHDAQRRLATEHELIAANLAAIRAGTTIA
jgi:hypothetical protein